VTFFDSDSETQALRLMLENSVEGFIVHDLQGLILDVNRTVYERLAYSKDELLTMQIFDIDKKADENLLINSIWPSFEYGVRYQLTGEHKTKDGMNLAVRLEVTCIKSVQQTPLFFTTVKYENSHVGEISESQTESLAMMDSLTGVVNRGAFLSRLESEISFVERNGEPLSLLLIGLDNFNLINKKFDFETGNEVLKHVANTIYATLRTEDLIARFEGDKFAVLLRNTDLEYAETLAERLIQSVSHVVVTHKNSAIQITVSIGVVSFEIDDDVEMMLARAEKLLLLAKDRGRNCIASHQ
jgi:diguanylate cyclase (GGDEF)-like protein/PAS domain S-box-containing protein